MCGQVCPSGGEQVCVWTGICVRADMNGNKYVCESSCVCVNRWICGQVCV